MVMMISVSRQVQCCCCCLTQWFASIPLPRSRRIESRQRRVKYLFGTYHFLHFHRNCSLINEKLLRKLIFSQKKWSCGWNPFSTEIHFLSNPPSRPQALTIRLRPTSRGTLLRMHYYLFHLIFNLYPIEFEFYFLCPTGQQQVIHSASDEFSTLV